jgi:uncharacterized SAM-binding protein YcdF (DUF218 family)
LIKWIGIFLSLILITCLLLILANAGRWLVIDQPPRKADVIIVLSGDPARTQMGIDLYHMGYAPYLLFTSSDSSMEAAALGQGVPARAIILEERADSTYENALYSKTLMEQDGLRSALVVSSDYHMLRSRLTFLRVFQNTGVAFTFTSVPDPRFHVGRDWWTSSRNIRHILREYSGIASLYLGMGPYVTDTLINRSPLLSFIFNLP